MAPPAPTHTESAVLEQAPAVELSASLVASLPTLQTPVHSAPTRLSESLRNAEALDLGAADTRTHLPTPDTAAAVLAESGEPEARPLPSVAESVTEPPAEQAPKLVSGPSAIFSADPALIPMEHGLPALPMMPSAPAAPAPTTSNAAATPLTFEELMGAPATAKRAPKKRKRRWLARLLVLGGLGAAGYFGVTRGPELYERYVEGVDSIPAEPAAPLAFPNGSVTPTPIRTAEFTLVGLAETPGATYRVTTDFETAVSQVDIARETGPDLQVLTFADDAMIRRAGAEQWYILERGQFPLDGRLNRADWVRRLDELLPTAVRSQVVIDDATKATISGVPTRHLSVTLDAALLMDALAEPTAPDPAAAEAPPAPQPADAEPTGPSTAAVPPVEPVVAPPASGSIQIELWIDGDGLIRQVSGAQQLGAETITIVRTTSDAWIPDYPTPDQIATLTASALVDLGI